MMLAAQVRFNTFQFAVMRLALDVVDLHRDMNHLLRTFPGTQIKKSWSGLPDSIDSKQLRFLHLLSTDLKQ